MTIHIGADHRGWELKNALRDWLKGEEYEVIDVGAEHLDESDDYPDYGAQVAQAVAQHAPGEGRGITICGSGAGMAVVANKIPGARASLIHDPLIAAAARRDDDLNVLALGSDHISLADAKEVVKAFLTTEFDPAERHVRRLQEIQKYER